MTNVEMLAKLKEHHRVIRSGLAQIKSHCDSRCVDGMQLSRARVDLTQASRARSAFVSDVIIPTILKSASDADRVALSEFLVAFTSKRIISDRHIATWSDDTIAADVDGYCAAARTIWSMMEDQMIRETRVLGERLRRPAGVALPVGRV